MTDVRIVRQKNVKELSDSEGGIYAFAKKIGRSGPFVSKRIGKTVTAYIGHSLARDIESIYGLPAFYLDVLHNSDQSLNTLNSPTRLPVISMNDILEYLANPLGFASDKIIKTMACPTEHSPNAFVTIMVGDAMVANNGLTFPDGNYLFIEPDLPIKPGSFTLIKVDQWIELRQLAEQFGKLVAKPLNPSFSSIELEDTSQIVGTCIATTTLIGLS